MEVFEDRIKISFTNEICYSVHEQTNLFDVNKTFLERQYLNKRCFIIIDEYVEKVYGEKIREYFDYHNFKTRFEIVRSGEANKSIDSYLKLFEALDEFDVDRVKEPILSIGGGVVTDLGGFVASTYRRSVPHIQIPTTLMGYVDAAIGIKTGVDFNEHKNRMGTFNAPHSVFLDRSFLKTLSKRHIINGVGEIVKIAIIKDKELFHLLEETGVHAIQNGFQTDYSKKVLSRSIIDMLEELEPNMYEKNLERCVDFGHTFSTVLEMLDIEHLLHGEAVAVDVAFSSVLAYLKGILPKGDLDSIIRLILKLGLPVTNEFLTPDNLWMSVEERIKHRGGLQRIPLPKTIGHCYFENNLTKKDLAQACNFLFKYVINSKLTAFDLS